MREVYNKHHGGEIKSVNKLIETVTVYNNIVRHDWYYGGGGFD